MFKGIESVLLGISIYIIGVHCLGENCKQNLDCPTQNSICVDQKCVCHDMSVEHESKCLLFVVKYQGYCETNQQCEWLGTNSTCTKSHCVCEENYRWFQGQCRPYVNKGETCGPEIQCYNRFDYNSLKCGDNHVCVCNDGYYDRGVDCRMISKEGGECAIDLDCQNSTLTCQKGVKCARISIKQDQSETDYIPIQEKGTQSGETIKRESGTIKCHIDDDCGEVGNSQCDVENGICRCLPGTYFYQDNCMPGISACNKVSGCSKSNTICFKDSSCVCKPGYYMLEEECHPELGVKDLNLKDSRSCLIKPALYQDNTCFCKNYWYNDDSNLRCIKPMAQQFNNCPVSSESCNVMGLYSYCNTTSRKCSCNKFSKFNKTTFVCDKVSELPKGDCLRDGDCNLYEMCNVNKCECIPNFSNDKNGVCLPDIGGSCELSTTLCSHIGNAKCAGGTCICPYNTSYVETVNKCLRTAHQIHDECDEVAQCELLKNTVCDIPKGQNDTVKRCICDPEYVEVEMVCWKNKEYRDPCMTSTDCIKVLNKSFQCRNSICQCPLHYKLKDGYCQSSGSLSHVPAHWIVSSAVLITALKAL